MSPDPSRRSEQRRLSDEGSSYVTEANINAGENDDDNISYEGYEVLPQDYSESHFEQEDVDDQDTNSDTEDEVDAQGSSIGIPSDVGPSTFDRSTKIELTELWNSSNRNGMIDITMDSTKEEEIKNAMASFKLPSTSIPVWANSVPEEEWKQQIFSRISCLNKT